MFICKYTEVSCNKRADLLIFLDWSILDKTILNIVKGYGFF